MYAQSLMLKFTKKEMLFLEYSLFSLSFGCAEFPGAFSRKTNFRRYSNFDKAKNQNENKVEFTIYL